MKFYWKHVGLFVLAVSLFTVQIVGGTAASATQQSAPTYQSVEDPVLPFDMPSRSVLTASDKLVFAQYFLPHPISLDNKPAGADTYAVSLMDPMGQNGMFAPQGGIQRDRPLPREPLSGDWRFQDFQTEVRQAVAAGLDGFALGYLNPTNTHYGWAKILVRAAEATDPTFKFILTPDMATGGYNEKTATPEIMATSLKDLAGETVNGVWVRHPSMYTIGGDIVVHPFPTANKSVDWWSQVVTRFNALTGGEDIVLWTGFADWKPQHTPYNGIAMGHASWGEAAWDRNQNVAYNATLAHQEGKKWMQPLHAVDQRPVLWQSTTTGGYYAETRGTETLRLQWEGAIAGNADAVQIITWNDYSETPHAPSAGHGWGFLDLSDWYLARFKTGQYPTIKRDAIYLAHRNQFTDATPNCTRYTAPKIPCTALMTPRGAAGENLIEATTFLTAPGTVTVTAGTKTTTYQAPAGRYVQRIPLQLGTISAVVTNNGQQTAAVTSKYTVTATPEVQDMQYHVVSSLRDGETTEPPPDSEPPTVPAGMNATVDGTDVTLTWNGSTDPSGVANYTVQRSQQPDSGFETLQTTTTTKLVDTDRPKGTSWYYRLTATDTAGNTSTPSQAIKVDVVASNPVPSPATEPGEASPSPKPARVRKVRLVRLNNGPYVQIAWQGSQSASAYEVRVTKPKARGWQLTRRTKAVIRVLPSKSYSVRVRARNDAGRSPSTRIAFQTD